jgi:uncharacterized membrane protein HdeD (DUF308 family)
MLDDLARNWWAIALRGLVAILFGLLAIAWPGVTITVLVLFFGAYVLVDGLLAIVSAIRSARAGRRWGAFVLEGIASAGIGIISLLWPAITALALVLLVATWAIVTGILEIVAAVQLRRELTNEWLLGLAGVVSILFGLLLAIMPGAGAVALVWLIGAYAVLFGILLLALALRLRGRLPRRAPAGGLA